jgi:uncharacterized protein YdhG (YjbR/CyaY superfamily)
VPSVTTVDAYLAALPPERREVVAAVRKVVAAHLPAGYEETFAYGMIYWGVPLARFSNTYNRQPLGYVALAAQKSYYALHLMNLYVRGEQAKRFEADFARAGKKLDMGKGCVRFKRLEDLPLDVIAKTVASTPPEEMIAWHVAAHSPEARAARSAARKGAATKPTAKRPSAKKPVAKASATKTKKRSR